MGSCHHRLRVWATGPHSASWVTVSEEFILYYSSTLSSGVRDTKVWTPRMGIRFLNPVLDLLTQYFWGRGLEIDNLISSQVIHTEVRYLLTDPRLHTHGDFASVCWMNSSSSYKEEACQTWRWAWTPVTRLRVCSLRATRGGWHVHGSDAASVIPSAEALKPHNLLLELSAGKYFPKSQRWTPPSGIS